MVYLAVGVALWARSLPALAVLSNNSTAFAVQGVTAIKIVFTVVLLSLLLSCESDNSHFCARYQYVYGQLLEKDLPPYGEMKYQLLEKIAKSKNGDQQSKFMLFVLEDWYSEFKPQGEPAKDFCMRIKRWQYYR